MIICRNRTRRIQLGRVAIGGGAPVSLQSMCNTDTRNAAATLDQIAALAALGCDIIRVAVPDAAAAAALPQIVAESPLPVVADIHFDYRLALQSIAAGVAGIRLNPGNLGDAAQIRQVVEAAGAAGIVIRVGANFGSVRPELLKQLAASGVAPADLHAEALVHSALGQCRLLEEYGFQAIKVSLKASSVPVTLAACRRFAEESDYPQHLGITEAGTPGRGIIKSAAGLGAILMQEIGDTIRVSLTADPAEEVIAGRLILESCGLRDARPEIVSCPTCGRTEVDLIGMANRVEALVSEIKAAGKTIDLAKIAVMGCAVNGPGEARDADLGLAGARGKVIIFRFGEVVGAFSEEAGFEYLKTEILRHTK